jgi:hypothetical protein
MIMLATVLHRDGEPPEPGLHLSPRGRLVNLGSSGGASASSGSATLRSGGLSIPGYANSKLTETTFSERFDGYIRHRHGVSLARPPQRPMPR